MQSLVQNIYQIGVRLSILVYWLHSLNQSAEDLHHDTLNSNNHMVPKIQLNCYCWSTIWYWTSKYQAKWSLLSCGLTVRRSQFLVFLFFFVMFGWVSGWLVEVLRKNWVQNRRKTPIISMKVNLQCRYSMYFVKMLSGIPTLKCQHSPNKAVSGPLTN